MLWHVRQPDGAFRHHKHGPVINVVVGSLCWLLVTKHLVCYSWRCWRAHVLKKFWCAGVLTLMLCFEPWMGVWQGSPRQLSWHHVL